MKRFIRSTLGVLGIATLLTGCSSIGSADLGETEESASGLIELNVGVIPTSDSVPLYLGIEEGIFEDHGLSLNVQSAGGGAAVTSAVLSGAIDIGLSNVVSTFIARDQGFPVTIIGPAAATTGRKLEGEDHGAVLVSPNSSDITSVKDLENRTVAINALNNANDILIKEAVNQAGGDPQSVKFVEIAFQDLPAALSSGRVDAAVVPEPFQTMARDAGAQWMYPIFSDVVENYPNSIYLTTDDYLNSRADVVEKFQKALAESAELANSDQDKARTTLASYTEMDADLLERVVLPQWPTELNVEGTNTLFDLTSKYGVIQSNDENKQAVVSVS